MSDVMSLMCWVYERAMDMRYGGALLVFFSLFAFPFPSFLLYIFAFLQSLLALFLLYI